MPVEGKRRERKEGRKQGRKDSIIDHNRGQVKGENEVHDPADEKCMLENAAK